MTEKLKGSFEESSHTPLEDALPEVPGPNSMPSGSRFETSTEVYAGGYPSIKVAEWSVAEAKRQRAERFNS